MRTLTCAASALLVVTLLAALSAPSRAVTAQSSDALPSLVTQAEYERWQTELSNWGRWGPEDEMGALNLVTPAKRREAAALVTEGFTVSLAATALTERTIANPCPVEWNMVRASRSGASDQVAYPCIHGPGTTHIDSLAHISFDDRMWNGYQTSEAVTMEGGAARNSILNVRHGIVTRGVLYDIARLKGVPYLEPGTRITVEDLEAWEAMAGVRAGAGDAFLLRWGRWTREAALGPFDTNAESAGLDNRVIPWLKERDVAVIGWETSRYRPQPEGDLGQLALHNFVLAMLGVSLLDRADLNALAEAAAERNRWEFMLTVAPLPIPNGTGSPINPIAIF